MKLVISPSVGSSGITRSQGTELFTPDGSKVTGIESIKIEIVAGDTVRTTVVLNAVMVSQADYVPLTEYFKPEP